MKYSIIIPCYNVENYISNTIQSVITQTHKDLEIILINDGSTDKTIDILNKYKKQDNRIKIINRLNGGVSSARNEGIKNATGDFLYFLDGDDVIESTLFEKMENILLSNNYIQFIAFGYKIVKNNKEKKIFSHSHFNKKCFYNNELLLLFLQKKIRQSMCSFIVKKDIVINNKILFDENTTNGEDQEFQIKCMYHSKYSYYISDILFTYLQRDNSTISNFSIKYLTLLDVFERLLFYFDKNKDKQIYENLKNYALLHYFYILKKAIKNEDEYLIKLVLNRFNSFDTAIKFDKNIFVLQIILLKFLFKFSPKLLIKILKKV